MAVLMTCCLALRVYADAPSGNAEDASVSDSALSREALQARGAELDNFIYEIASSKPEEAAPEPKPDFFHKRSLWIAAGGAGLIVLAGVVYLLIESGGGTKQVYLDYSDAGN